MLLSSPLNHENMDVKQLQTSFCDIEHTSMMLHNSLVHSLKLKVHTLHVIPHEKKVRLLLYENHCHDFNYPSMDHSWTILMSSILLFPIFSPIPYLSYLLVFTSLIEIMSLTLHFLNISVYLLGLSNSM